MPVEPAYKKVAADLRRRIARGEFPVGEWLPPMVELQRRYDSSVTVIRMALSELELERVVDRHQGKGTKVIGAPGESATASGPYQEIIDKVDQLSERVRTLDRRVAELERDRPGHPRAE
jgi:GntR family uxuAB operon transcriptional repressor